jgi:hypothetical protein
MSSELRPRRGPVRLAAIQADRGGFGHTGHASDHMPSFVVPREVEIVLATREVLFRDEFRPDLGAAKMMDASLGKVAARLRFIGVDGRKCAEDAASLPSAAMSTLLGAEWPTAKEQRRSRGRWTQPHRGACSALVSDDEGLASSAIPPIFAAGVLQSRVRPSAENALYTDEERSVRESADLCAPRRAEPRKNAVWSDGRLRI